VVGNTQRPASLKDALAEARAVTGGGMGGRVGSAGPGPSVATRKTILVVDDDASMRARLRTALEPFYDVLEAKDGLEATELAAKIQPPAMIVCDVVMPRLDGFGFAKIMRSNPIMRRVPIMFVSSRNSPQDVTQALALGACQYVVKTTPTADIVAKIRKIVL
jgi:CheY-like chemotaxis protein